MTDFQQTLIEKVRTIREKLSECESISTMDFSIDVSGRVHDGELELTYRLGSAYSTGGVVKGGNLDVIVEEYLHRFGFDKRNQVKLISFVEVETNPVHEELDRMRSEFQGGEQRTTEERDEIPF